MIKKTRAKSRVKHVSAYNVRLLKPGQHALHYRGKIKEIKISFSRNDKLNVQTGTVHLVFPEPVMISIKTRIEGEFGQITKFSWQGNNYIQHQRPTITDVQVVNIKDVQVSILLNYAWAIENESGKTVKADLSEKIIEP